MQYVVRTDQPFNGIVETVVKANGIVNWSGGKTLEEYKASCKHPVKVVSNAELDELIKIHEQNLIRSAGQLELSL